MTDFVSPKDFIANSAKKTPEKIAITFEGQSLTFAEFDTAIKKASQRFKKENMQPGSLVVLFMSNSIEFFVSLLAVLDNNAVAFPVSPKLTTAELKPFMGKAKVDFVIADKLKNLLKAPKGDKSNLGKVLLVKVKNKKVKFKRLINNKKFVNDNKAPEDKAMIMTSSGTTGTPKLMYLSKKYLYHTVKSAQDAYDLSDQDIALSLVPPQHIMGIAVPFSIFYLGATLHLVDDFNPGKILQKINDEKITVTMIAPFALSVLADLYNPDKYDVSTLQKCISGGSPLSEELYSKVRQRMNIPVQQAYGSIETSLTTFKMNQDIYEDNVGKVVINGELKIFGDDNEPLPQGEVGRVGVSSPTVIEGYLNTKLNNELFIDKYFLIGDRGFLDQDNNLHLVGRTNFVINVAGKKVDPVEIENVLNTHAGIKESLAYGEVRENTEVVKAFIVLQDNNLRATDIQEFCKISLSDFKIPKSITFIDVMPRNRFGKIQRSELFKKG